MKHIGPIVHPVLLANKTIENFMFDYFETEKGRYAACYIGDIEDKEDVLLRVESACIFGHVFGVARCDCNYQLEQSLVKISKEKRGIVIYAIDQDARGLGIDKHFEIYVLRQKENLETKEVYERLKCNPDVREYDDVAEILKFYKIKSVKILTNNPRRLGWLEKQNINYERVPLEITLNEHNSGCLMDEKQDLGYLFSFKTHQEWFQYIIRNMKDTNKENNIGCIITNNFREIICEVYDNPEKSYDIVNQLFSNIKKTNMNLKAYLVGEINQSFISLIFDNGIKQVFVKKGMTKCDFSILKKMGIDYSVI